MKILLISTYPPAKDGIADYTERFIDSLSAEYKNIEVNIIAPKSNKFRQEVKIYRTLGNSRKDLYKTLQTIDEINPDIIHLQYCISLYGINFISLYRLLHAVKRRWPNIKKIVTLHEIQREQQKLGYMANVFYKQFTKLFDGFIVHTEVAQNVLENVYHIPSGNVLKINFPIARLENKNLAENVAAINKKYSLQDKLVVLLFGFIQIDKGIDDLVQAIPILNKSPGIKKKLRVVVAGDIRARQGVFKYFERKDKKYLRKIHKFLEKENIEHQVVFTGYVKNSYVSALFSRSDIIAIPYTSIEQSSVLGISLNALRPIVATDVGGLGETLRHAGILVGARDYEAMAEAINKIYESPQLANKLVEGYRSLLVSHSSRSVNSSIVKFYRNCEVL